MIFILAVAFSSGCQSDNNRTAEEDMNYFIDKIDNYEQLRKYANNEILLDVMFNTVNHNIYSKDFTDIASVMKPYHDFFADPPSSFCIIQRNNYMIAALLYKEDMYFFIKCEEKKWEWRGIKTNGWASP